MSLETPTINSLRDTILGQIETALSSTLPAFLPKAFTRVLAKALAAVVLILYKYGGFIFLQMFVRHASDQPTEINGQTVTPLQEWGELVGIGPPGSGTRAELRIDVTVTNQMGVLPSGAALTNTDNGVTYITLAAVPLDASVVQVTIRARADQSNTGGVGAIGNLDPGDTVQFVNPQPNVAQAATVDSQTVTGANLERTGAYRQRVLDKFQKRPQGGAYADYEQWGEEAEGIINVYPYTGDPGEVDVYSEATVSSSGNPDGIPTPAQLQAVLDLINFDQNGLATRRPANAWVNSLPITRTGFDVVVDGIAGVGDLGQVQANITTLITNFFFGSEPFIVGLSVPPRTDIITRTRISSLVEDVVTAAGGTFTSVTFELNSGGGPIESYQLGEGEKAKLVDLSFV